MGPRARVPMRPINRRHPPCRGFTLIEAMSAVLVLTTLGSIASFMIVDAVDGYAEAVTGAQVHAELSVAMDRAMRELRKVPVNATEPAPATNLTSVTTSAVYWEDESAKPYSLTVSGGSLLLQAGGASGYALQNDVTAFTVAAYDEDNAAVALPVSTPATVAPIRRVELDITVTRDGVSDRIRSRVFLRSSMSGSG